MSDIREEIRRKEFMVFLAMRAYNNNPGKHNEFLLRQVKNLESDILDLNSLLPKKTKRKVLGKKRK